MTHVHFIGIGGSGLSAIARLLKDSGYTVTGSDRTLSPFATDLQAAGVTVYLGHHPRYIQGANWIVRSSAVSDENPEVVAARQANIPVYKRADFLGKLMEDKTGIAIAGTHGKTTTTAMTAFVMTELGCDPSFIVGGVMNNYGVNARAGKGSLFVIEADEYDRMFLGLKPRIEIITNMEHDHPDCYPTFEEMVTAFESFISLLPNDGTLIACLEDQGAASLMNRARRVGRHVIAYSIEAEMTIKAQHWIQARNPKANERGGFDYEAIINIDKAESVPISLQVPGRHNVLNSLAVMAATSVLGLSTKAAAVALGKFTGTGRRFEVKGKKKGIIVIDDYAHHPTEIKATLAAAKARYPKQRIVVVWQPHTYSRTKTLFNDFILAFEDADEVIVTEIYAAREPKQDFSSAEVVNAMQHPAARFIASLEETTRYLLKHLRKPDVLFVLSAGDADQVSANVLAGL
jgi:UDP-N-acetylmuramate--alanine ligase